MRTLTKLMVTALVVGQLFAAGLAKAEGMVEKLKFKAIHQGTEIDKQKLQKLARNGAFERPKAPNPFIVDPDAPLDRPDGYFEEDVTFTIFLRNFKAMVLGAQKEKLAKQVQFPLRGTQYFGGLKHDMKSEKEFIKHFDDLFSPVVRQLFYVAEEKMGSRHHEYVVSVVTHDYDEDTDEVFESGYVFVFFEVSPDRYKLVQVILAG